jgi:hypothetical protein
MVRKEIYITETKYIHCEVQAEAEERVVYCAYGATYIVRSVWVRR